MPRLIDVLHQAMRDGGLLVFREKDGEFAVVSASGEMPRAVGVDGGVENPSNPLAVVDPSIEEEEGEQHG